MSVNLFASGFSFKGKRASAPRPFVARRSSAAAARPAADKFASAMVEEMCRSAGVKTEVVLGPGRRRPLMELRRRIAARLREAGYNYHQIGYALEREHSTILHMLKNVPAWKLRRGAEGGE